MISQPQTNESSAHAGSAPDANRGRNEPQRPNVGRLIDTIRVDVEDRQ